ncbi:MAG TPA: type VI secretion system Vgr family protein [Bacteroidales bacterium]|nr:type VI secretion system Vgr family protein [Bacteroidales bacterium]
MASVVDVKITLGGNKLEEFISLSVRQSIAAHHSFELRCRLDTFDKFASAAEAFVLEKAHEYIGKKITIELVHIYKNNAQSSGNTIFSGFITEVEGIKYQDAFNGAIVFRGSSPDLVMDGDHHCRSFKEMSLSQIVREVTKGYTANLFDNSSVSPRNTAVLPYIVQYNETNYQFIRRLAARFGEWMLVTGSAQFYFGDPPEKKAELTHGKDLHEFACTMKLSPLGFSYANYDYYKEEKVSKSSKSHNHGSDRYLKKSMDVSDEIFNKEEQFFYNFLYTKGKSEQDAEAATKADKFGRIAGLNLARGSSENSELTLGGKIHVGGVVDTGNSVKTTDFGEYRIIALYHSCDEAGNYMNHFEAVPAGTEMPPGVNPFLFPPCETQSAVILDTNDPEGFGRVKVRFHWQSTKEETPWIRVVTPYAGNNKGIFFIPEVGEEVLVAFENDNAENPYVVGAHYNGKKKPDDWKSDKNYKKAIRTKSGHTIEFNDEQGKEEIVIYDKDHVNTVTLSSHGKLMSIECKGDLSIKAQKIDITAEKDYTLDVKGKIDISSQKETDIKAVSDCKIKSNKNVTVEAMSNLTAKANAKTEVSGAQLTAKGSATAELSSGAQTVVKGAIVRIN